MGLAILPAASPNCGC